jgi:uncharacterized membrane protein YgdD (TMEM256/DUF423 family)
MEADRLLLAFAGLLGAAGVAGSAAAAHLGGGSLATAAQFALFHAPAVIAAVWLSRSGLARPLPARAAAWLLAVGALIFSGAVALSAFELHPVPMAAPTGGTVLILAWLALAASALAGPSESRRSES